MSMRLQRKQNNTKKQRLLQNEKIAAASLHSPCLRALRRKQEVKDSGSILIST